MLGKLVLSLCALTLLGLGEHGPLLAVNGQEQNQPDRGRQRRERPSPPPRVRRPRGQQRAVGGARDSPPAPEPLQDSPPVATPVPAAPSSAPSPEMQKIDWAFAPAAMPAWDGPISRQGGVAAPQSEPPQSADGLRGAAAASVPQMPRAAHVKAAPPRGVLRSGVAQGPAEQAMPATPVPRIAPPGCSCDGDNALDNSVSVQVNVTSSADLSAKMGAAVAALALGALIA